MIDLRSWLQAQELRFVPLFDVNQDLEVGIKPVGKHHRPILKRSPVMEEAMVEVVETGLTQEDWQGVLYIMGWGELDTFRMLYIGKADRKGVSNPISENLKNLRANKSFFARWGDNLKYHIGDLSHAMFRFDAYCQPSRKYERWSRVLFSGIEPPVLREPVNLCIIPWRDSSVAPSGFRSSLPAAEKEIIALASVTFAESLLNADGR